MKTQSGPSMYHIWRYNFGSDALHFTNSLIDIELLFKTHFALDNTKKN